MSLGMSRVITPLEWVVGGRQVFCERVVQVGALRGVGRMPRLRIWVV